MKKLVFVLALALAFGPDASQGAQDKELKRWEQRARNVTIIRDDWGIAHISGKTDADAVFGAIYAQAEDDFNRVETNYINSMGRLAEAEGEAAVWRDLRMKLFIDPDAMKAQYEASPVWLQALMNAWADGLNFYLARHPKVTPRVIKRFEPWMALTFTEGSIGGDIETISLETLQAFYGNTQTPVLSNNERELDTEPTGSNGIAISPKNAVGRHALLLINPHTSFFFRSELQMTSEEGLNAYGASTWGQSFIYQGFNDRAGWMHTSSAVDGIDWYFETIVKKGDRVYYKYGDEERPVTTSVIKVPYKIDKGIAEKTFTVYRTHHGPIIRAEASKWFSVRLMQEPVKSLIQSYTRTKAKDYKAFKQTGGDRWRRERQSIFAALQRPGEAIQHRRPARSVFLSFAAQGSHRAEVPSGKLMKDTKRITAKAKTTILLVVTASLLAACGNNKSFDSAAWLKADVRERGRMSEDLMDCKYTWTKTAKYAK